MSKYISSGFNNIRIIPMEYDEETIEEVQKEYFENRLSIYDIIIVVWRVYDEK